MQSQLILRDLIFSAHRGNDLVAATACAASGAQMVLFTTGRGTPFASPVPTVKIATNSRLAGNKGNWIDFNAGRIVTDDLPLEDAAKELFQLVLDVASGKKVKAEVAGFHDFIVVFDTSNFVLFRVTVYIYSFPASVANTLSPVNSLV